MLFDMPDPMKSPVSTTTLYPQLSPEELREAEENLRQYLAVVRRIFEYLQANDPKILTELRQRARLRKGKGA
jgi:hypothetical protein